MNSAERGVDDRPYPHRGGALPHSLEAVDAAWLTSVLIGKYSGMVVHSMDVVEVRNGHTTKIRARLSLNEVGRRQGMPENVCIKANWSGSFAEVDIHRLEARFYHYVAERCHLPAPAAFFSDWEVGDDGQGVVVMEDLAMSGGRFGHSLDHLGVDGATAAMKAFAGLHAALWGDPRLDEWTWLPTSMDTPIDCDQLDMMWPYVERNLDKPDYRAALPNWLPDNPQRFRALFRRLSAYETMQTGPRTLVHGDAHQGNSYVRPGGERIWIDWQLVRKGRPWRDLCYFLVGALTIDERRAEERRLLAEYRAHLVAHGVTGVPNLDAIWEAYRRWPVYGCQAWLANMDEWGQSGLPMVQRFFTALDDLDTVRLLETADAG